MATDIGSPQRFFHMPRFQHQAPRQVFYKRPDFAQQQAMQQLTFDGKRMRKAVNRKTIDYNPSVIRHLEVTARSRDARSFGAALASLTLSGFAESFVAARPSRLQSPAAGRGVLQRGEYGPVRLHQYPPAP